MDEIESAMGETNEPETETESTTLEDSDKLSKIGSSYDLPLSDSDYESILRLLEAVEDLED